MAIKLVISNKVTFKVEGSYNDEDGAAVKFNFSLTCKRLLVDQLQAVDTDQYGEKGYITNFMVDITTGWKDVKAEDGTPEEFSEAALRQLFQIPGIAALAFSAYTNEVGGKAKNS